MFPNVLNRSPILERFKTVRNTLKKSKWGEFGARGINITWEGAVTAQSKGLHEIIRKFVDGPDFQPIRPLFLLSTEVSAAWIVR